MLRPPGCRCQCKCCYCKTWTLHEWTGDYDFTGDLDIRNYPGFQPAMLNQRSQTSMLWRIRYSPDQEFIEFLTDNRIAVLGSFLVGGTGFVDYFPFSNAVAILSGPVRDGIMYGLDMTPAGKFPLNVYRWPSGVPFIAPDYNDPVDQYFKGTATLNNYETNGNPAPGTWTFQEFPDNPVSIPWSLELGCARCPCLDSVSWPDHLNWHYDPAVPYSEILAINPEASTLVSSEVEGGCQSITTDDIESVHWPGDEAEPDHPALCNPDCIVWVSEMYPPSGTNWTGGGARSMPGKSLGADAPLHSALSIASAAGRAAQLVGWTGRRRSTDATRADRGDSADIENVNCIWLVEVQSSVQSEQNHTYSYDMTAGDFQWIVDWLAIGNKTLIADAPWKCRDTPLNTRATTSNDGTDLANANLTLSRLGSSLSLYRIGDSFSKVVDSLTCQSTELHPLAPDPETLFGAQKDPVLNKLSFFSGHLSLLGANPDYGRAAGISGGTAIYEYDCTLHTFVPFSPPIITQEIHPCVAVEEQANGSRIIAGSISIDGKGGGSVRRGLSAVPDIASMIARAISS